MGCDIHLVVEKRVNGKWQRVNKLPPRSCSWCDGRGHYEGRPNDKCYWCGERARDAIGESTPGVDRTPYQDRNYTVFSVLADVRNDGNVKPITEPRGIPDDATHARGDGEHGDHSFSWLTLAELLQYDWTQEIDDEGFVDAPMFKKWDAKGSKGHPENWCGGVGGGLVEHVSNDEMRAYLRGEVARLAGKSVYTNCHWSISLTDYCKSFLAFMEVLLPLGKPEDVRIVFGFDS